MPEVPVTVEAYDRLIAFRQVLEALVDEQVQVNEEYVDYLVGKGIDCILAELLSTVDRETLMVSLQQLGARHPAQTYAYIADTLRRGAAVEAAERKRLQNRIGFRLLSEKNKL